MLSLSHWVWSGDWVRKMRQALPKPQRWHFSMLLLLSWNGFGCFSSTRMPPFRHYFPSQNMAPAHSPPPAKESSPDSHLKSKLWYKNTQKYSSCLTKYVYCKIEMYARLAQQIMCFAYLKTALWPKNSREGLSLNNCVWCEKILWVQSILWQSYWNGTGRKTEAGWRLNWTVCIWPVQGLMFMAWDLHLLCSLLYFCTHLCIMGIIIKSSLQRSTRIMHH